MAIEWAGLGPGVLLALDRESAVPLRAQLEQALREAIRSDRHLRRMRRVYAVRRGALVDALTAWAPSVLLDGLAAGFHAVAHLPPGADEQAIVERARERSVGLYGMSAYRPSGREGAPALVLGFGNLSEAAITRGVRAIGDLI